MKKITFFCATIGLLAAMTANGQTNQEFKYRRSSLAMVLVDANDFQLKQEVVLPTWNEYPFPDKYDKHDIPFKTLTLGGGALDAKGIADLTTGQTEKTVQAAIENAIKKEKIGNQLVAKWFNRSADGKFNMDLIAKRGFYNASDLDVAQAKGSARGTGAIADAGEELIGNTFISFTQFVFFKNEPVALAVKLAADLAANKISNPMGQAAAKKAAEAAYNATKDGQTLFSKTWLYRLKWDDETAAKFYAAWDKPAEFDKLDFPLELVGVQSNSSAILFALDGASAAIKKVEVRNIDKVFADLQQLYDVFKPKVPILTSYPDPLTASIGMKESLKGGEKFEVLEMTQDPATGRTKYVRIGKTKVDKKLVWDNRYNAGEKPEVEVLDNAGNPITATVFDKVKKAQPGMLLRQIK
jgi:hypothetical protein